MRRLILLLFVSAAIFAQKEKAPEIESCGLGSGHHCHCVARTDAIQTKAAAVCSGPHWRDYYKTQAECFREKLHGLDHCSTAETWQDAYDQESGETQDLDGHQVTASTMGPMCSMACKKHDCKCDDGPTCHFGHALADHKEQK